MMMTMTMTEQEDDSFQQQQRVRVLFVCHSDPTKRMHRLWIEEWSKKHLVGWEEVVTQHQQGSSRSDVVTSLSVSAQLVLDPTKSAYQAFAIRSSTVAAFGLANTWYYIKAFFCRLKLPIIKGEPSQLGADFVVAPRGTVLLQHYCRDPTDRVRVQKIVHAVQKFEKVD